MNNPLPAFYVGFLLLLAGICGCSQQPKALAHQIAAADRIVATNKSAGSGLALTGESAKKFIQAVAAAKRDRNRYQTIFDWDVQFYAGTNALAVIRFQNGLFLTQGAQYRDETGVLQAFYVGDFANATAPSVPR